jgi:hypothetical protein
MKRTKQLSFLLALALLAAALFGCQGKTVPEAEPVDAASEATEAQPTAEPALVAAEPIVITDMMGREVRLEEPATRIVALTAADCEILYAELAPLPLGAIAEFSADGTKTAYTMFGASLGFCLVLWLEQRYIRFSTEAAWWAQLLKVGIGLALVIAVRTLLKDPLLALCGGHNVAHMLRYLLMVLIGGAVWPLSFRLFEKTKKQHAPAEDTPAKA